MFPSFSRCLPLAALAAGLCLSGAAQAEDHPLLGRYEGAEQIGNSVVEYDEAYMITGPVADSPRDVKGPGWTYLEGRIQYLYYRIPAGISSLALQRNYLASLEEKGATVGFACSVGDGSCFLDGRAWGPSALGLLLDTPVDMPTADGRVIRNLIKDTKARYIYAFKNEPEGVTHIALALSAGTEFPGYIIARVVEAAEMPTGQISVVTAGGLKQQLEAEGQIALYGIHFDFDKAEIKPESAPQLVQIAALLRSDPALTLEVVGHTDNQGDAAYNLKLSQARAEAVVRALVHEHGIAANRLTALGKGMEAPVADNDTEAGRAQNRRVELVKL